MRSRLRSWWRLRARERWVLLWMMIALPLLSLALGLVGYARTRRCMEWLSPHADRHPPSDEELRYAQGLARLADIAGRRGLWRATCLRQSLLLYGILRRRGLDPEIRLGVSRGDERLHAHAWVELAGYELGKGALGHRPFAASAHEA